MLEEDLLREGLLHQPRSATNPDLQPTVNRRDNARGCALLSGLPADLDRHVRYDEILLDQIPGGFPRHLQQQRQRSSPSSSRQF